MYCFKCKTKTETNNLSEEMTKNNRKRLKGVCKVCGRLKSQFVSMRPRGGESTCKTNKKFSEEIYGTLVPVENELKKQGYGLFLGNNNYQGGFLPLAALIPLIGGIMGGIGGLTGGIASAVSSAKTNKEQERHNRAIETIEQSKSGSGAMADALNYVPVIGKHLKPIAERLGLGKEHIETLKNCNCKLIKKYGRGLFLGRPQVSN